MVGQMLVRLARQMPAPMRRLGRAWWFARRKGPPFQLRMACALGEAVAPPVLRSLAPGYSLVGYAPQFHARWLGLLNAGGEFGTVSEAVFKSELLDVLIPDGAAFVFRGEALVACAAACALPVFLPSATLSYVMVHPDHRGHRLGQIVTGEAMARALSAGYSSMILQTDDHRLPAIKMYLKLGFIPIVSASPDAPVRWDAVLSGLQAGH